MMALRLEKVGGEDRWGERSVYSKMRNIRVLAGGSPLEKRSSPESSDLTGGMLDDVPAIGVVSFVPQAQRVDQLLRGQQLPVAPEHALHEIDAGVLAQLQRPLEHVGLGLLDDLDQALFHHPLAAVDEITDHLAVDFLADLGHHLTSHLHLPGGLDEEKPELCRHLRDRFVRIVRDCGPIVDPSTNRVRVEDTAQ